MSRLSILYYEVVSARVEMTNRSGICSVLDCVLDSGTCCLQVVAVAVVVVVSFRVIVSRR